MTTKVNGAAYSGIWVEKQVSFLKLIFNLDISALVAANLYELGTTTGVSSGTVADSSFAVVESALVQAIKALETKSTVLGLSTYKALSYASVAGATSSGTTVTTTTTVGLTAGMGVTVTAGTGTFAAGTIVTDILSPTTFSVSIAPSVALSGGSSVVTGVGGSVDAMLGFAEGWFSDAFGAISTGNAVTFAQAIITSAGSAAADAVGVLVNVVPSAVSYSMEFAYMDGTMTVATLSNLALATGPGSTPGSAATPNGAATGTANSYQPVLLVTA